MTTQYIGSRNSAYIGSGVFPISVDLVAATVTTAGAVAAVANPAGVDLIIVQAFINVTTAATTATNTIDAGVAATAATSSDTLFDGQVTTAGLKVISGTNGLAGRLWTTTQFVTASASATLVGMVGTLTLVCVRA